MVAYKKLFTLFALILSFQVIASQANFLDFDDMADREEFKTETIKASEKVIDFDEMADKEEESISEQKTIDFDEMADREDEIVKQVDSITENFSEESYSPEAQQMIKNLEAHMGEGWGLSDTCKTELLQLTSVINVIKNATGNEEKIFYGAKAIVEKFPGLEANCSVPLPTVNTNNWSFEKFKQAKCAISGISFAASASTCLHGGIFSCASALASLKSLADCIKLVNMN